jgi:hypothetical protein
MDKRNGARELGLLVASLTVLVRFVDEIPLWAATALVVVTAAAGTANLRGEAWPWQWSPDRLALPALSGFAAVGTARLVDPVPWLVFVFLGVWLLVGWAVAIETLPAWTESREQLAHPIESADHPRPLAARTGALGVGFLAFAAVGGVVPAGLAGDGVALTATALIATIALDVVIGGLIGYRISALARPSGQEGAAAFYQYGVTAGHAGGLLRVAALPRLFGPALLVLTVYLVTGLRESPVPIRRNGRLLRETLLLVVVGLLAVVWGLLAR